MIDLEAALIDLGDHLDAPPGDELIARVVEQLSTEAPSAPVVQRPAPWRQRNRALLIAAAVLLALVVTLSAVTPTREAIAHWLGIGAIEVRNEPLTPTTLAPGANPVPGAPTSTANVGSGPVAGGVPASDLAAAQARVDFPLRLPLDATVGSPLSIVTDDRAPGGLVAITYPRFTLIEVASAAGSVPVLRKTLSGGAHAESVSVVGHDGLWITGDPHEVGYVTRQNDYVTDSVRRAGDVLIWEADGITFRIEGLHDLAEAQAIAASIR